MTTRPGARRGAIGTCPPGYARLGASVLRVAFDDAQQDTPAGAMARGWLGGDSQRLHLWCALAGCSVAQVHRQLARIEAQHGIVCRPAPPVTPMQPTPVIVTPRRSVRLPVDPVERRREQKRRHLHRYLARQRADVETHARPA